MHDDFITDYLDLKKRVENLERSNQFKNITIPLDGSFTPPKLTTTERNALTPVSGLVIYNTTVNKHQGYNGTTWVDFY